MKATPPSAAAQKVDPQRAQQQEDAVTRSHAVEQQPSERRCERQAADGSQQSESGKTYGVKIRAKRKVIALLHEQKQAIIHRAVTRGPDPAVPLKDSGILAWGYSGASGGVAIKPICPSWKWFDSISWQTGLLGNNGTYPWLNSSQVNRGFIDSADQFVTPTALRECHLPRVLGQEVYLSPSLVKARPEAQPRGLAWKPRSISISPLLRPEPKVISPEFLQLALVAAYQTLPALSEDSGSTKGALTCEDITFKIALPPRSEQIVLVQHIRTETQTLNTAISRLDRRSNSSVSTARAWSPTW